MNGRWARSRRYSSVTESYSMIPFLAPASMAMLVMVSRPSMSMDRRASPLCSIAFERAPSTPMVPITCRIRSLASTHSESWL